MTRMIVDAATSDRLRQADDVVELCDEAGQTLGFFHQASSVPPPGGWHSPFSDEEIRQRLQEPRTGRPLADILRDLGAS